MSTCETCWADAYARSRMFGGCQAEHYRALLAERAEPCPTPTTEAKEAER